MAQFLSALFLILQMLISVFLVCLVLIQRGKGGGLAGAFGGQGGSSAFGSKAGDIFTRVTMITAGVWILFAMIQVVMSNQRGSAWADTPVPGSASKSTFVDDKAAPTDKAGVPAGKDALAPAPATGPITLPGGPKPAEPVTVPATKPDPLGPGAGPGLPPDPFTPAPSAPATTTTPATPKS